MATLNDSVSEAANSESLAWQIEGMQLLTQATANLLTTELSIARIDDLLRQLGDHLSCDVYTSFKAVGNQLELLTISGLPDDISSAIAVLQYGEKLCGKCAQLQEMIYVPATSMQEISPEFWAIGLRCYIAFPVFANDQFQGTLAFASRTREQLSPAEIEFVRAMIPLMGAFYVRLDSEFANERQQAQQALMLDSVKSVIWSFDIEETCYHYVSGFCCELLGFPAEDWYAPGFWEARVHPEDLPGVTAQTELAVKSGKDHEIEYRMTRKDGRVIWVKDLVKVIVAEGTSILLCGTIIDITEQKQADERMLHNHKMEAIDRLAGGMAHDFNNALAVIRTYTEILLHQMTPQDEMRGSVQAISEAVVRATALTKQMLMFSRQAPTNQQKLDINDVLMSNRSAIRQTIGEEVQLSLVLDEGIEHVQADRMQIEQMLLNLAANSVGAMPKGGRLTMQTRRVSGADLFAKSDGANSRLAAENDFTADDCVELTVRDNGCGMDSATKSSCLEPFFSTHPVGRGTGMGLAVAYGVVKSAGGWIDIESEPGNGTSVRVYLPAVK